MATETEALLIDNEIDYEEFSPEVEACLPAQPWTIPAVSVKKFFLVHDVWVLAWRVIGVYVFVSVVV